MTTKQQTTAVIYKGRKYKQLWRGATKYGERCHLQSWDGKLDFWCDPSLVTPDTSPRPTSSKRTGRGKCCECGTWGPSGEECKECCEGYHL